jgi:tetratricopeptide (TPR) repeat protein/transcriptional regulator with XRE-family HTH domain
MVKKAAQATPNHLLRRARLERGWTQKVVADRIGAPNDMMITRWERGTAFPSAYYIERLCQLFEQKASDLGLLPASHSVEPSSPVAVDQVEESLAIHRGATPQQHAPVGLAPEPGAAFLLDPAIPQMARNGDRIVGRVGLLQQVKHLLAEAGGGTAIALHGLPGVGKTTLAALLVADSDVQECFPEGILWAGLGPAPNLQGVLARWATLLGVPVTWGERAIKPEVLVQELQLAIGHRRMLLVIDDAWTDEDALALHVGGAQCVHLLTTRLPQVAFAFASQQRLLIPELDAPTGVELLAHYVPALVKENPQAIDELVSAVGGLPLALTLLGHYLAAQAFSGQPRRLQTALQRLHERQHRLQISMLVASTERSPALPSQTPLSLHTAIALSTQMLDAEVFRAFCALSVLPAKPASFSEEAALAVTQCSLETLDILWDSGLLESSGPARYMLHQTVREYGQQQQQEETLQRRFVAYMVSYLHTHQREYAALEQELACIQEALEMASTFQMDQELLAGLREGMAFFQARGLYRMAEHYLWHAWEVVSNQGDAKEQAIVSQNLASTLCKLGNYARAKELAEQGLALTRSLDEKQLRSRLLQTLGDIADNEGDRARAEGCYQEGLHLARQAQDTFLVCSLSANCGKMAWYRGQTTQALNYLEKAMQLARQHQYMEELGFTLCCIGGLWSDYGNYAMAEQYLQEGLQIAHQFGQRENLCYAYNNLGCSAFSRGEFARANAYCQQGQELARLIQHRALLSILLETHGECFLAQHEYSQARQILQEAVAIARQIKHAEFLSLALCYLGKAIGYMETYDHAIGYFQESIMLAQQLSAPLRLITPLTIWGETELFHGQFATARQHFLEVLALEAEEQRYPEMLARAHYGLAHSALQEKNIGKAREHAAESMRLFKQIGYYKAQEVQAWIEALPEGHTMLPEQIRSA